MKRKIKKIFFEIISNNKIFSMKLPTTKILSNLQGELSNVEYGTYEVLILKEIENEKNWAQNTSDNLKNFWYENYYFNFSVK